MMTGESSPWHERTEPGTTMRTQCGSILLMVTFFVCGSLLSPLHIFWRNEQSSTRNTGTNNIKCESSGGNGATDVSQSPLPFKLAVRSSVASASAENTKDDTTIVVGNSITTNSITTTQTNFSGILARPFEPWTHPLPCFAPDKEWSGPEAQQYPANRGFLYLKVRTLLIFGDAVRLFER